MKDLGLYKVLDYCIFSYITEDWKYIVSVEEESFNKVIEEAEACCRKNNFDLISEIDENDFCDGNIIYKNYKINGREFAYITFKKIDWN